MPEISHCEMKSTLIWFGRQQSTGLYMNLGCHQLGLFIFGTLTLFLVLAYHIWKERITHIHNTGCQQRKNHIE